MAAWAFTIIGGLPSSLCRASSFLTTPSSCLMFVFTFEAINSITSNFISSLSRSDFLLMMAHLVSKSGGWISAIRPHSNLFLSRSSRLLISFGGRSDTRTICLPALCRALNVWKNSSWVLSLPAINWISSISSTSACLYLFWKSPVLFSLMAAIISFVKVSPST